MTEINNAANTTSKRNAAIDGMRAIAVIAIVAFHLRPIVLPGGFLGVTMFLVMAGYFSTVSLLKMFETSNAQKSPATSEQTKIPVKSKIFAYLKYLFKRVKRIWPSTIGIIALSTPLMWLFSPSLLTKLQSDALTGASFTSNMAYILRKVSYFEQSGLPSPIKHLWYLGLIMQIFVFWPIILWAILKIVHSKFVRMCVTAILMIACSLANLAITIFYGDGQTIARVYYSIDTRAGEFLIGALLAMYCTWFSERSIIKIIADACKYIVGNKSKKTQIEKIEDSSEIEAQNTQNTQNKSQSSEASIPDDLLAGLQVNMMESDKDGEYDESDESNNEIAGEKWQQTNESENTDKVKTDLKNKSESGKFAKIAKTLQKPLSTLQKSIIGLAALIFILWCLVKEDGSKTWIVYGGYTIFAIVCAILMWSCLQKNSICTKILEIAPLKYIGLRSFAIYIVHFPILEILNPATRTTQITLWEQAGQCVIVIIAAEVFYRIFEMPLANKHITFSISQKDDIISDNIDAKNPDLSPDLSSDTLNVKSKNIRLPFVLRRTVIVICAIVGLAIIAAPVNWNSIAQARAIQLRPELNAQDANTQNKTAQNKTAQEKNSANTKKKTGGKRENIEKQTLPTKPSDHRILNPIAEKVPENINTKPWKIDSKRNVCTADITMVGDSVTEGAKPYLMQALPNAWIDGKVSRQIFHGAEDYQQDLVGKHPGSVVIYELGTNGPPRDESVLQNMVNVTGGKPVYFVTTRVPQPWQDETNARLRAFAAKRKNVGIIDWYGLSAGHSEFLTDDGIHLTPIGGPQYARMIRLAVCGG